MAELRRLDAADPGFALALDELTSIEQSLDADVEAAAALAPRDYLSTFMKLGTIAALAVAILVLHPEIRMPALTPFIPRPSERGAFMGTAWRFTAAPCRMPALICCAAGGNACPAACKCSPAMSMGSFRRRALRHSV